MFPSFLSGAPRFAGRSGEENEHGRPRGSPLRGEGETIDDFADTLELGTPEAAVRSCVSLIAAVTGQQEEYLAFWMDLYYQVRRAYERGREPPPLRREDLAPAMREIWGEMLTEDASGHDSPTPARRKGSGKKAANAPEKPESQPQAAASPSQSPPQASATGNEEKKLGTWTIYKRKQLERLRAAREAGLTLAQIEKEDAVLTVRTVTNMLGGQYATRDSWSALEKALDRWDRNRSTPDATEKGN